MAQQLLWDIEPVPGAPTCNRWRVGRQEVILGDCLQVLTTLSDETIDVVVTSPPYNIGVAYRTYDDLRPRDAYLDWLSRIGRELHRLMRSDASFFLDVGSTNSGPWIAQDVACAFRNISGPVEAKPAACDTPS